MLSVMFMYWYRGVNGDELNRHRIYFKYMFIIKKYQNAKQSDLVLSNLNCTLHVLLITYTINTKTIPFVRIISIYTYTILCNYLKKK